MSKADFSDVLLVLSIVFGLITFIGMIKPWIVFWWSSFANRLKVLKIYGLSALAFYLMYLILKIF